MIHKTVTENLGGLQTFVQLGQTNRSAETQNHGLQDTFQNSTPAHKHAKLRVSDINKTVPYETKTAISPRTETKIKTFLRKMHNDSHKIANG